MNNLIINTEDNVIKAASTCRDPYDNLGPKEWVDKQIEYGCIENHISGKGLLLELQKKTGDLVCCEIGVCHGFSSEYFLKNISNIKTYYAIDNYPVFTDWDGTRLTFERQEETKNRCKERLDVFDSKVIFIYEDSSKYHSNFEDDFFDFIFVDGDHSYEATLKDIQNYWPKMKKGGLFAGHDINLQTVSNAINEFFKDNAKNIKVVENNAWFIIK